MGEGKFIVQENTKVFGRQRCTFWGRERPMVSWDMESFFLPHTMDFQTVELARSTPQTSPLQHHRVTLPQTTDVSLSQTLTFLCMAGPWIFLTPYRQLTKYNHIEKIYS